MKPKPLLTTIFAITALGAIIFLLKTNTFAQECEPYIPPPGPEGQESRVLLDPDCPGAIKPRVLDPLINPCMEPIPTTSVECLPPTGLPTSGPISLSWRAEHRNETCHTGVDIAVPTHTNVAATMPGYARVYKETPYYGYYVEIFCPPYHSLYAHLSPGRIFVSSGDWVNAGDIIAESGASGNVTGPHIHYAINFGAEDPLPGVCAGWEDFDDDGNCFCSGVNCCGSGQDDQCVAGSEPCN